MYHTFWLLTWRIAECITLGGLQLFKTWNLVSLGSKIAECITLGGLQLNAATQQFLKELQKISLQLFLLVEFVLQGRAACHTFVNS